VKRWEESGNPWTVLGVTRPFENAWFAIDAHDTLNPVGNPASYAVIRIRRIAVGVLPIDAHGRVRLVGQWRFPLARYSWEMPEGGAEPGEDPLDCARRELKEETGLTAGRIEEILHMDLSNSLTDERAVLYLATDLSEGEAAPEETEVLARRAAPFAEVLERVVTGEISDALTVAAVLRAHHMAKTGRLPDDLVRVMLPKG
jgi:8-oxo-dGTP pyrophosphatase MutT (NUDIX family)